MIHPLPPTSMDDWTPYELAIAWQVQASFLPRRMPTPQELEDFEVLATLEPARVTAGDFFDVIPLWDGRLALVVADVADKGLGAALMMALSRTLIRTYIIEYSTRYPDSYHLHPQRVLNTVNRRIMEDAANDLFVTAFLGFVDPGSSSMTYANAGHNPPFLYRTRRQGRPVELLRTGMALAVLEENQWERSSTHFDRGDVLVLYSDGLTEAINPAREFFGEARLHDVVASYRGEPLDVLHGAILSAVQSFCEEADVFDDITLMVLRCTK